VESLRRKYENFKKTYNALEEALVMHTKLQKLASKDSLDAHNFLSASVI
jgi:hypothetical protein